MNSNKKLSYVVAEPADTAAEEVDDRRVVGGYETTITKHPYQVVEKLFPHIPPLRIANENPFDPKRYRCGTRVSTDAAAR